MLLTSGCREPNVEPVQHPDRRPQRFDVGIAAAAGEAVVRQVHEPQAAQEMNAGADPHRHPSAADGEIVEARPAGRDVGIGLRDADFELPERRPARLLHETSAQSSGHTEQISIGPPLPHVIQRRRDPDRQTFADAVGEAGELAEHLLVVAVVVRHFDRAVNGEIEMPSASRQGIVGNGCRRRLRLRSGTGRTQEAEDGSQQHDRPTCVG